MSKEFLLHCDFCGRKVPVRNPSDIAGLTEVPLAPIPGGVPVYNASEKKIEGKKSIPRQKMFKCRMCGRGIVLKQNMVPAPEDFKETVGEKKDNSVGCETSLAGQPVSGIPARSPVAGNPEVPQ